MSKITFEAFWHGERAAGINPGSETVTIEFANTSEIDAETVEYFREALRDYYDGASVLTQEKSLVPERIMDSKHAPELEQIGCPICGMPRCEHE